MTTPTPFEIKDYRQPVVTSIGVILGFLMGFLINWVTDEHFSIRTLSDQFAFVACLIGPLLLLIALFRMLNPISTQINAILHYQRTLKIYFLGIMLPLFLLVVSAFIE
jgi:hypothetical protein